MTAAFKNKRFLVFGGSAALCLLFLLASTMMQINKQRVLKSEHRALQDELNNLKQTVDTVDVAKLEEENGALSAELNEIEQALPEQDYVPTLLRQIEDLAATTGVTVAEWRKGDIVTGKRVGGGGEGEGEEQQGQAYSEMDMDLALDASYKGVFNFVKQLGTMGKIISVESIDISKVGDAFRHDGFAAATVRMSMKAYILPPRSGFPGEVTIKLYT